MRRMRLALYEPDIPQNTGTILRLAACLGVAVDVIGPTGFDMTDRALGGRRSTTWPTSRSRGTRASPPSRRRAGRGARASCCSPRTRRRPTRGFAFQPRRHPAARPRERRRARAPCTRLADARLRIPMRRGPALAQRGGGGGHGAGRGAAADGRVLRRGTGSTSPSMMGPAAGCHALLLEVPSAAAPCSSCWRGTGRRRHRRPPARRRQWCRAAVLAIMRPITQRERAELAGLPDQVARDQARDQVAGHRHQADQAVEPHADVGAGNRRRRRPSAAPALRGAPPTARCAPRRSGSTLE